MSVKLLIVFISSAIGTGCGFIIMKSYKRNCSYFGGLCSLIGELKRNISYRRDSAASVLGNFNADSPLLEKNIGEYLSFVTSKQSDPEISKGFLSQSVYVDVKKFFTSLGRSDGNTQLDELEMYGSKFTELLNAATAKSNKYGTLVVKLGFLFGLAVGILFL